MNKCEKCGRLLTNNEHTLCPACKSNKSHKRKRVTEIVGGVLVIVGGVVISIIKATRGGGA